MNPRSWKTRQYVAISRVSFGGILWEPESSDKETLVMVTAIKSPPAPFKEIRAYEKPRLLRQEVAVVDFVVRVTSEPTPAGFYLDENGESLYTDRIAKKRKRIETEKAMGKSKRISIRPVLFSDEQKARVNKRPKNGLYNNGKPMKPLKVEQTG